MKGRAKGIVKGTLFSVVLTLIFALLLATVMYFWNVPELIGEICVCMIGALSCAIGAYSVAKVKAKSGLLTGGGVGMLYYLILSLISVAVTKNTSPTAHNAIMLAMTVFSGMLGGVLAMPRE